MRDAEYMRRALELARSVEGRVSPRPPVGAVLVRDDRIVGEGATAPSPGPHAEVVALAKAGRRARGATMYVSLEPCSHHSVTPPCADAVAAAGVARVVAACRDPYPAVRGRGFRKLRAAGVQVRTNVLGSRGRRLIEPFAMWATKGRPFVTVKLATSLDGRVAAADGTSRWITGETARAEVHALRARVDAVLVGAGTVVADDPQLTCRLPGYDGPQPLRVVLDSSGRTPAGARVYDTSAPSLRIDGPPGDGGVDLSAALKLLAERGVCHVLAEPGPALTASLLAAGLADRLVVYLAPVVVNGAKTIADVTRLRFETVSRVGEDLRIHVHRDR